jgi:hypothetical protein
MASAETLPALPPNGREVAVAPVGVEAVRESMEVLKAIRTFIKEEFREGLDFGVIPNTGAKPTLYKPGAEKATMYFNAAPRFRIERNELGGGHVEFIITTELVHRATGREIGSGVGSCSTMESKYRYRGSARRCPHCGADAIIRGKAEYGGGWICFGRKGGCGAKFKDRDPSITGQSEARVENPDIYDVRNTVLKMAKKRSQVDAALGLGCLSELFTQDIEETYDLDAAPDAGPEPPPRPDPRLKENRPDNKSGTKTGQYATEEQRRAYLDALEGFLQARNAEWLDWWTDGATGELRLPMDGPKRWGEPLNIHQADGHLLKECLKRGHLDPRIVPADVKVRQLGGYTAIVYHRDLELRRWLGAEMNAYARRELAELAEVIYARHPDLRPEDERDPGPEPEDLPDEPGARG